MNKLLVVAMTTWHLSQSDAPRSLSTSDSLESFHNPCATNVNTARGIFPHFRVDNYLSSEFRGMRVNQLKKYFTDRLIILFWSMRRTFCSFTRETMLESCNLRCKMLCYNVRLACSASTKGRQQTTSSRLWSGFIDRARDNCLTTANSWR